MYVIRGRLDPEVGATLMRALEAAGEALYGRSAKWGRPVSFEGSESSEGLDPAERQAAAVEARTTGPQRRADAIGLLAERALQSGLEGEGDGQSVGRADRFQVVLHVDTEALLESSDSGDSILEDGVRVPAGTSRRIACDASRVVMTHDRARSLTFPTTASVLDVGRKSRTVPPAIRRALDRRDGGCRFPGCGLRFCDVHHITHWADGGETRLDNLVLLCRRHHRAVHEEGFGVEILEGGNEGGNGNGSGGGNGANVLFYWPDGRAFPDVPPAPELPGDPVAALEAKHRELGIRMGSDTTTPPLERGAVRPRVGDACAA